MTPAPRVTQTVILAAGNGSRLSSGSKGVPKPLTRIGGIPLLAHALAHARAAGCVEAVIVVGYEGGRVMAAAEGMAAGISLRFVETPDHRAPNGLSLLAAEPLAHESFFLQMVDHLFGDVALTRLTERPLASGEAGRVLVDGAPLGLDLDDATKVRIKGDRAVAIGKGLDPWDAIDAGCFVLTHDVFDALRRVGSSEPRTVSSGMRQLVERGALGLAHVDGIGWVDVDTPADMQIAERLIHRPPSSLPTSVAAASS
jgi:1L-myo-inositol 1-phosphate cytidylyltransferase